MSVFNLVTWVVANWRLKLLDVDLVIVNEHAASYAQDLQAALEAAVRASQSTLAGEAERGHGTVFILPYATNLVWKHGVPKSARYTGRRISVTLRAFTAGVVSTPTTGEA